MSEKIKLNWFSEIIIDGDKFPRDTLDRTKYSEFLTQFLIGQGFDDSREDGDKKRNYVLNLNSEWGSGKTYFLKRWSKDLQDHFPVVYIDAWQQDYSDDPLMTVISSVIKQLRDQAGMSESNPKFQLPKKALGLLKAAAPGFARSMAKRYLDIDLAALMQGEEPDIQDENGLPIDMGELASTMVKQLIDEHDGKKKAIDDLKVHVANWVQTVTETQQLTYPAFIFIDELDRCRPSYAVEMLETIKHIFDIKGIVFVVATDTEQLQHAVKAIYGEGFNARVYLGRFFNSRFSLKVPDLKSFLEVHTDISKLSGEYLTNAGIQILPPNDDAKVTLSNISIILDAFKMPPRTAIQIADRVVATISNMPKGSKIDILMLVILLSLKEINKSFFSEQNQNFMAQSELLKKLLSNQPQISIQVIPSLESYILYSDIPLTIHNLKLSTYLDKIFLPHFSNSTLNQKYESHYSGSDSREEVLRAATEDMNELIHKPSSYKDDLAISWIKSQYYLKGFDLISISAYQDYVELASALDLIEEGAQNG